MIRSPFLFQAGHARPCEKFALRADAEKMIPPVLSGGFLRFSIRLASVVCFARPPPQPLSRDTARGSKNFALSMSSQRRSSYGRLPDASVVRELLCSQFASLDRAIIDDIVPLVVAGRIALDDAQAHLAAFCMTSSPAPSRARTVRPAPPVSAPRSLRSDGASRGSPSSLDASFSGGSFGGEDRCPPARSHHPPRLVAAHTQPADAHHISTSHRAPTQPQPAPSPQLQGAAPRSHPEATSSSGYRVLPPAPPVSAPVVRAPVIEPSPTAPPPAFTSASASRDGGPVATPVASSGGHRDAVDVPTVDGEEVRLYVTSITGSRQVRDHCRALERHLYLLQVPHETIDVTETSNFVLPRLRRQIAAATGVSAASLSDLELPLLFVGDRYVGDFGTVNDLVDADQLVRRLKELGAWWQTS